MHMLTTDLPPALGIDTLQVLIDLSDIQPSSMSVSRCIRNIGTLPAMVGGVVKEPSLNELFRIDVKPRSCHWRGIASKSSADNLGELYEAAGDSSLLLSLEASSSASTSSCSILAFWLAKVNTCTARAVMMA